MKIDFSAYRVLAVDDIPTNVLLLKMMLEQSGLQVFTAENSDEAVAQLEKEKPDLILLDVLMPGTDGFQLAKQLKEHPDYREIPIVFLTALNAPTDVVKGFHLGADDYITKPFNKEELLVRVRHQLTLLEAKRTIERQKIELEQTIAGRDALYSVIAHDLRMPMSSMKMILNILSIKMKEDGLGSPEILESVQNANEISEELFVLLDNLLKWTRSQLGKLQAIPQQIYLSELVEATIEVSSLAASSKDIHINCTLAEAEDSEVYADTDMIKTVVRNLVSNAIKYSYHGGEINIVVESSHDEVIFKVTDQGCGISKEDKHKLLDVATHYTTFGTDHESGSGLGLLLVNEFLNLNKGRLFFQSKEKEGSTFGFALPNARK